MELSIPPAITSVQVMAAGTGQSLKMGENGDADLVMTHAPSAEKAFVDAGFGIEPVHLMYNDFVIVGPGADPAAVKGAADATSAFARIAGKGAVFISRADKSGTHAAEMRFWKAAAIDPIGQGWYKEAGTGMGPTLNMAAGVDGYTLSDRGTWANFRNRQNLAILHAGDPKLFNPYGAILVSPDKHPHVKKAAAERFIDWLTSDAGRDAIAAYRIGGEQLFFPSKR